MYLARLEIIKDKSNEIINEEARLVAFDSYGKPFMKIDLEDLEIKYIVVTSFNHHGDTYLIIKEK